MGSADGRSDGQWLSSRGLATIAPMNMYHYTRRLARKDPYHYKTNPKGYVMMNVAENWLSRSAIADALGQPFAIDPEFLGYNDTHGILQMREVIASFFKDYITKGYTDPNHLAILSGAGGALDVFATVACDPGDKIMVTGPGYHGFAHDFCARSGVDTVVAHLSPHDGFRITVAALETARVQCQNEGGRLRAVALSSPNNPTGEVLSPSTILEIVYWARAHGLQVVFDEVYALSGFDPCTKFVSVAEVLQNDLGDDVHIVWSFSKDFSIAGCRMGVLYSQNESLMTAVSYFSYFLSTSGHTQAVLRNLLQKKEWVRDYVAANQGRLMVSYLKLTSCLESLQIPYIAASAGFFVFINLSRWMKEPTLAEELRLWQALVDEKVVLTPGSEMNANVYGWFRCCFATLDAESIAAASVKIRKVLATRGHHSQR